jgi:hypothetical protein
VVELFIKAPYQGPVAVTKISLFVLQGLIDNSLNICHAVLELKFNFLEGVYLYWQKSYVNEE